MASLIASTFLPKKNLPYFSILHRLVPALGCYRRGFNGVVKLSAFTLHPPGYSIWNGYGMDGIHKIGYGFHGMGDGFHLHGYLFHGIYDGFHPHSMVIPPPFHPHSMVIPWSFHPHSMVIPPPIPPLFRLLYTPWVIPYGMGMEWMESIK